ncbi:MAG: HAMP domain-containing histidine kinase [Rhodospirillales bacterium]|nr:HAMP domain-containing histidine kinase [Rhodospirillales bacterium]MBO6787940.1 HAMP domain-containing histidine kinase [Rhodospirillales bacterium]
MIDTEDKPQKRFINLSTRLLIMTVLFVMLAEVLIWTPSVARYRKTYIEDFINRAYLSMVALDAMPHTQPNQDLENELLRQTDALAIIVNRPDRRMLMVGGDMPPPIDLTLDMRDETFMTLIAEAFETLTRTDNRVIRAIGMPPKQSDITVEVIFDEQTMRAAMLDFSWRIFVLSLVISAITASLVYLSLQWMIVRPIRNLTSAMVGFRENPEDPTRIICPTPRSDEIGTAQHELAEMQSQVQLSLKQKNRLAAMGSAMTRINHDLRNTLATAVLVSDKLQAIEDPEVKRVTPRLMKAIDRAIDLCSQTLNYAADDGLVLRPRAFGLRDLIEELQSILELSEECADLTWSLDVDPDLVIVADRRHLLRALHNLCSNAGQAGAKNLTIQCAIEDGEIVIDVVDDGPGLPEKAQENLFQAFAGSSRDGGTGLGLVIVREVVIEHGGDIELLRTGPDGTAFRIHLPDDIPPHPMDLDTPVS